MTGPPPAAESTSSDWDCPICLFICADAVECDACSAIFCQTCVRGVSSCPTCRADPLRTHPNGYVRRLIAKMPAGCDGCGAKMQRGDLAEHRVACPDVVRECAKPGCDFEGNRASWLDHVNQEHWKDLCFAFQHHFAKARPNRTNENDPIATTTNSTGRIARLGKTGQYYCGGRLDVACNCCNGDCGPNNGCPCRACMALTIKSRCLAAGFLVNKVGATARKGTTGKYYCGRKIAHLAGSDGWCGPTNGPNCHACKKLDEFGRFYPTSAR
ncbi:hypothetical protein M427DRAFT_130681 [Gonapodya prolifera JEL478]|uniref:RING-type domain-containing protein n=1 Tax=Gonapodya prolifera (strain JEL478) TaxID=1344416 RepID=A0A139AXB5_GONPJ|nr:hypothetical protein M427DRAFT_130681 [Gonapodya prolifera JEL478]|eukprot:KXS21105.1 hypothetical protein M427DRAFT_130681 [Gonapodya prolifera JEL478]